MTTNLDGHPNSGRLVSLDAYRGLTMLLMASYGFGMWQLLGKSEWVASHPLWAEFARQFNHPVWEGCTLWDLIFPSFLFVIGVAMPHSYEKRAEQGQSWPRQLVHAAWRGAVIFAIGVFLDSYHGGQLQLNFPVVLHKIGVCYVLAFLVLRFSPRVQLGISGVLLVGHSLAYALYGDPETRWAVDQNVGHYVQHNWLHLEVRNGNTVMNAVTGTVNVIFGILCGRLLQSDRIMKQKLIAMIVAGVATLVAGYALSYWIPINKWLWTSSYTLWTGGFTFLIMAFFYGVVEMLGYRRWTFPFVVVGMNSIMVYVFAGLFRDNINRGARLFFDPTPLADMPIVGPIVLSSLVLGVIWLFAYWLFRYRVFIKV